MVVLKESLFDLMLSADSVWEATGLKHAPSELLTDTQALLVVEVISKLEAFQAELKTMYK
jgi:hypothetical protein